MCNVSTFQSKMIIRLRFGFVHPRLEKYLEKTKSQNGVIDGIVKTRPIVIFLVYKLLSWCFFENHQFGISFRPGHWNNSRPIHQDGYPCFRATLIYCTRTEAFAIKLITNKNLNRFIKKC